MNVEEKEDEYFINKRAIGELFDSKFDLNVNLWRGKNPHNKDSIFYPILKAFKISNGNLRPEDIKTYKKMENYGSKQKLEEYLYLIAVAYRQNIANTINY